MVSPDRISILKNEVSDSLKWNWITNLDTYFLRSIEVNRDLFILQPCATLASSSQFSKKHHILAFCAGSPNQVLYQRSACPKKFLSFPVKIPRPIGVCEYFDAWLISSCEAWRGTPSLGYEALGSQFGQRDVWPNGGFHKWGVTPQWLDYFMDNPINIRMILGYPYFRTPKLFQVSLLLTFKWICPAVRNPPCREHP